MTGQDSGKNDKNELLLGIKYEAARLGGVSEESLAAIAGQARKEIGAGWDSDEDFVAGRNAVRAEHGLDQLSGKSPPAPATAKRHWRERFKGLLGG